MSLYIKEEPEFLNQCLKSLKEQVLQADEIVLILDGPITSDLNSTIIKWQENLPIKIFPQEKNLGLGMALNIGLKLCRNEIIFRMDTDDICSPNRFKNQIDYLSSHPEVDVLSCSIKEFNSTPGDLDQVRKVPKKENVSKYISIRNPINHMSVVYKKSKILSVGSYKHLEFMEDYYLWLRCHASGHIIDNNDDVLVYARIGNGMLERRTGGKYIISEWRLFKHKMHLLPTESKLKLITIFLLRSITRVLPKHLLNFVYKRSRN